MKAFYVVLTIVGIVVILIGAGGIYVGQDNLRNAELYASYSYLASSIQDSVNQIESGHYRDRSESDEKYLKITATQRLKDKYEEKGKYQIIIGVVIGVVGLLIVLFGYGEARKSKQSMASGTNKKCPFCAEVIKAEANVCRYCGKELPDDGEQLNVEKLVQSTTDRSTNECDRLDKNGNSPLMLAAVQGNLDEVLSLLNKGANPVLKDKNGMTAINRAANKGHHKIVQLLEKAESVIGEQ